MTDRDLNDVTPVRADSPGRGRAFTVVRILLGVILLAAAILKGHQAATQPLAEDSLFSMRWFVTAQVLGEYVFALLLLAGVYARQVRWLAIVLFAAFAVVSAFEWAGGAESCGCFGSVQVPPYITMLFDILACVALVLCRPADRVSPNTSDSAAVSSRDGSYAPRLAGVVVLSLLGGIPAGIAMATFTPNRIDAQGNIVSARQRQSPATTQAEVADTDAETTADRGTKSPPVVLLEPQEWVGTRWPLLRHVDIADRLAAGTWLVVIHHHDCSTCEEAIPMYQFWARDTSADTLQVAFVEMPPYGPLPVEKDTICLWGSLTDSIQWFATTPVVVLMQDARVLHTWQGQAPSFDEILSYVP